VVFLAPVDELRTIYDSIGRYARRYLSL